MKKQQKRAGVTEARLAQAVREAGRAAFRELDSAGLTHTAAALSTMGEVLGAVADAGGRSDWSRHMHALTRPARGDVH